MNYYNEINQETAAWLVELMFDGQIPLGKVDTRDIWDVTPGDLHGFTQCHFFAGIGGWSQALKLAGWPEDRPVWTGSCPCQPFSAAGKGAGLADERHLWPAFKWLLEQCRPPIIFGEQVASGVAKDWLDHVSHDMEGLGYAFGAAAVPACSVGAPQLRQRTWFVANSDDEGLERLTGDGSGIDQSRRQSADEAGQDRFIDSTESAGPTNGFWRACDWIACRDGKWRPVEPGTSPLADGIPRGVVPSGDPGSPEYAQATGEARKMRLHGYGNAIVPQVAAEIIKAAQ